MKHIVAPGVLLGALLGAWVFTMGFTGWYKHPSLHNLFWVVLLLQIAIITFALRRSAEEEGTYLRQVWRGVGISGVAGGIVIINSLIFTTLVFPHYFEELREMQIALLKQAGKTDADIKVAVDAMAAVQTPVMQALFGFLGTVLTGFVVSLVVAASARRKKKD